VKEDIALSRPLPTVVGLIFALGWPLALAALVPNQNLANLKQDYLIIACEWGSILILFAIVTGWERLPFFQSVGFKSLQRPDWILIASLLAIFAAMGIVLHAVHPALTGTNAAQLRQVVSAPFGVRAALVLTAGICEEILFRGYALERLQLFTKNIWVAGLIGTVAFTLAHVPRYGFAPDLIGVFLIAAVLSTVYIWRRNIAGCIVLHWLIDGFGLLLVPALATIK
jgi:membrane protease YdiL (CAAX protease family)